MTSPINSIATAIRGGDDPGGKLRIGTVTAVEASTGRVRLDTTGETLFVVDAGAAVQQGDKVYAIVQGPIGIVVGRIGAGIEITPIGAITPYAGNAGLVPVGWLLCSGQEVSRTIYPTLFNRLGTAYGAGDNSTTFNVPNLLARVPYGTGNGRNRGATGGAETVALTVAQMPPHIHRAPQLFAEDVAGGTSATVASDAYSTNTVNTFSTGGGDPHENMPPFVTVNYIIKAL